jgi:hypothetical protein
MPSGAEGVAESGQDLAPLVGPHDAQISALDFITGLRVVDGLRAGDHGNPTGLVLRRGLSHPRRCQTHRDRCDQNRQGDPGLTAVAEHHFSPYCMDARCMACASGP